MMATSSVRTDQGGVMYYSLGMMSMEAGMVVRYLDDMLDKESQRDSIIKYSPGIHVYSTDMLIFNRRGDESLQEPLAEVLKMLNVRPEMRATRSTS
jgi:hypothetical protein